MRAPIVAVAWGLLSLTTVSNAQELDPIVNMCVRFDHQSVYKNNTLYIDGGRETFVNVTGSGYKAKQIGPIIFGYNEYLIAIDMSSSWDWKSNISEVALTKKANSATGTKPPLVSKGALYHGKNEDDNIYLWGGSTSYSNTSFPGFPGTSPAQYSLWSFDITTKAWNQYDVTFGAGNRPSGGSFTEALDQGIAFYFNGVLDSGSQTSTQDFGNGVKQYLDGMIVIDTVHQTARNLSTKSVVGNMPRSRGRMQYIKGIGGKGILVQIGGNQQAIDNTTDPYIGDLLPMNEVDIFDISSYYNASTPDGTWYKQTTGGDTPPGRVDFCLILASADGSSHNIYMYGGRGVNDAFYDDIWVLSIPSFVWTKVYQGSTPRYSHTCHRVGNRTMVSVGGAANTNYDTMPCDWETRGVGIFDMSALTWGSVYNANSAEYTTPDRVVAKIGGTINGGAVMYQPNGGFDSPGLAALFQVPYLNPPNTSSDASSPSASSSPSSSHPIPSSLQPNPHTAPIIGGLVGSLAFVGSVGFFGYKYWGRLRRLFSGQGWKENEVEELDGSERQVEEMEAEEIYWELPAVEKPVELWSPSDRYSKGSGRASTRGSIKKDPLPSS